MCQDRENEGRKASPITDAPCLREHSLLDGRASALRGSRRGSGPVSPSLRPPLGPLPEGTLLPAGVPLPSRHSSCPGHQQVASNHTIVSLQVSFPLLRESGLDPILTRCLSGVPSGEWVPGSGSCRCLHSLGWDSRERHLYEGGAGRERQRGQMGRATALLAGSQPVSLQVSARCPCGPFGAPNTWLVVAFPATNPSASPAVAIRPSCWQLS